MPTVEYQCRDCGRAFVRVLLRGEPPPPARCPDCGSRETRPLRGPDSLFDGIAPFSELARNRD